ncbi:MAG: hypothetical protein Q7R22_013835 [Verrucomicrobiota bacterium JB025]|nr:hypothetical protein [Verrucomicrobiota bacterium JB025]
MILAVVLAWFSPWWAGGRFLAPLDLQNRMMSPWADAENSGTFAKNHFVSDAVDQYLVYHLIAARDFEREGRVGWSSLTYGGTRQYANTMALYDDWTMHLHRWFDFKTAWHLGLLGQMAAAALGMYVFLTRRGAGEIWAVCGALLWAANSQFATWIYHRWTLGSFCWVPWILWAIDGADRGNHRARFLVPLFIALSFLGGTLQHAALVVLVVLAAWAEKSWSARGSRPLVRSQAAILGRFSAWGLLGSGLAAFMLIPCAAAFFESNALGLHIGTHGHASGWYPGGPLQPLFNFASYPLHLFPSLLGACDSLDVLKLFKSELFYIAFFGSVPMLIAGIAMFRKKTPLLARVLVLTGLLLPLTPLVRVLYQRLLLLFILGGIFAFVHFMTRSSDRTKITLAKWLAITAGSASLLWLAVSVALAQPQIASPLHQHALAAAGGGGSFGFYQDWVALRVDRFLANLAIWSPAQALPLALLFTGIAALRLCAAGSARKRTAGSLLLAAAAVCDVTLFAARWTVWSDEPLFAETPETRILRQEVGADGRTTTLIHPTSHMARTPFVPNTLAAYGIPSIHGYDSIVPDGMLLPFETPDDARRLGRLAVSHLVTWHGNPNVPAPWRKVWTSAKMDLYQNPLAAPRYAGFSRADQLENFHNGAAFDGTRLTETRHLENQRQLEIPPGISHVRVAENALSGWQYRITGTRSPWQEVGRGPDSCMEIKVGESPDARQLELRYAPPLRTAGLAVSGGSLACLALAAFVMPALRDRKSRHRPAHSGASRQSPAPEDPPT